VTDPLIVEAMLMNVGSIPLKLFDQPHPRRGVFGKRTTFDFVRFSVCDCAIVNVKATGPSLDKLTVFTLANDGRVFVVRPKNSVTAVSREKFDTIVASSSSSDNRTHFAFTVPDSSDLYVISSNGSMLRGKSSHHIDKITCSCFIGADLFTGGNDSILVKWRVNESKLENVGSLMVHPDVISCILGSPFYGIVISCSIDGLMVISIASDFSFLRSIEVNFDASFEPIAIVLARSVGRILVCSESAQKSETHVVSVYSLNGALVMHKQMPEMMTAWCTITTCDGFDYIAVADKTNVVALYDAYDMAKVRTVYQSDVKVTLLRYQRRSDAFIIGTETGELIIGALFR
jgi:WD40 repeat protein